MNTVSEVASGLAAAAQHTFKRVPDHDVHIGRVNCSLHNDILLIQNIFLVIAFVLILVVRGVCGSRPTCQFLQNTASTKLMPRCTTGERPGLKNRASKTAFEERCISKICMLAT